MKVLVYGLRGVGVETCKNLALQGAGAITVKIKLISSLYCKSFISYLLLYLRISWLTLTLLKNVTSVSTSFCPLRMWASQDLPWLLRS